MGDHLIPPVPPPADPALLAAANRALAEQMAALEAEVARLRAVIAAERGLAAPEGWRPEGLGWLHPGDNSGNNDRYVWPDGHDTSNGKDRREGTWWGWVVDERVGGRLIRSVRGLAPTALEAMEAADAAAGVSDAG